MCILFTHCVLVKPYGVAWLVTNNSDNNLSPVRHEAIARTKAELL